MNDNAMTEPLPASITPVPENWQTGLAIVAHPDDLEYGSASAVAKWTAQGKHIVYVIASRGEAGIDSIPPWEAGPIRAREQTNAARVVGVDTVEFLSHPDGVIEYGAVLRRDISRAIRRHRPDVLITLSHHLQFPSGHLNQPDHRAVGLAALDAARDAGNRWIFPELLSEDLKPWNGVRFAIAFGSGARAYAVDVSGYWEAGLASLREHKVYLETLGDAGSGSFDFLNKHGRAAGDAIGCEYACFAELVLVHEPFETG